MKLINLKTSGFGALGDAVFDFDKKSAVIVGDNENGKSTFTDALWMAMCGLPKASGSHGKYFYARYSKNAMAAADIELDGSVHQVDQITPLEDDKFSPEIFKNLLTLVSCEHTVSSDRDFIEEFSDKVLNLGNIDLKTVVKELENVFQYHKKLVWHKEYLDLNESIEKNTSLLEKVTDKGGAFEEQHAYENNLGIINESLEHLAEEKNMLTANRNYIYLSKAKEYLQKLTEYDQGLKLLKSLSSENTEKLAQLQAKKESETKTLYKFNVLIENANESLIDKNQKKTEILKELDALPHRHLIAEVTSRHNKVKQISESSMTFSAAGFIVSALLATIPSFLFYMYLTNYWPIAFVVFTGIFVVIWALIDRKRKFKEAQELLTDVLTRLEWTKLNSLQIAEKLSQQQVAYDNLQKKLVIIDEQISTENETKLKYENSAAKIKGYLEDVEKDLNSLLSLSGLQSYAEIPLKSSKAEHLELLRRQLLNEIKHFLGEDTINVAKSLEEYINGYKFTPEEIEMFEHKSIAAVDNAMEETHAQIARLTGDKEVISLRLSSLLQEQKHFEGQMGKSIFGLYTENQVLTGKLMKMNNWRKAAKTTHSILKGLSGSETKVISDCVLHAGGLFSQLTGGLYEEISVSNNAPFDGNSIFVKHKTLGKHPLKWLSSGAADLLWLSLRLTFAKSIYPKGAFLVLDEPFAMLDETRTKQAFSALINMPQWQFIILTKDKRLPGLVQGDYNVLDINHAKVTA